MTGFDAQVGIVGAGPVGLACAARLASFGVTSVVLEAEPALRPQGSKACLIQGDVLEVLDKFGCAEQIAAEGVRWNVARTYVRGVQIATTAYPIPIGFGPFVNISQYRIEQVVLAQVERQPQCEIRWGHEVTFAAQNRDGVTIGARTAAGPRSSRFAYVVACDGVRSAMRDLVGVEWTGYSHGDRFLITDLRAKLSLAHERHFHYDSPYNPGRQLVIHAQPEDVWRVDWQLPPDADIDRERRTGELDVRIRKVIGDVPYEIAWLSTYRFQQRVVNQFRVGRVFFAGDAAHALPPYGSRGMNSGIQDADNLAWKLAMVLADRADGGLLDSYHIERHSAARENLRLTEATIQFMVPPSRLRRLVRNAVLRASLAIKWARGHVNSGSMAAPHVYTDSPIVAAAAGRPLAGAFAPDGMVTVDGRRQRLRRLFGDEFVLLYSATGASDAAQLARRAGPLLAGLPVRAAVLLRVGATVQLPAENAFQVICDDDPGLRERYPVGYWFLVRPDGHVAASGRAAADGPAAAFGGDADLAGLLLRCTGFHRANRRQPQHQ